jgi:hypothetical protein
MQAAPTFRGFFILVLVGFWVELVAAQSHPVFPPNAFPGGGDFAAVAAPRHSLLDSVLGSDVGRRTAPPMRVDLAPVLDGMLDALHEYGIPLRQDRELSGDDAIVFTASFQVDPTLPPMQLHIGDSGPFDAFYANDGGFRFALAWSVPRARQFALHLGAGEDSEFGNWAIAGVQWRHPTRPFAIGLGMPVALSNADGPVGIVCQLRMLLD